MLVVLGILSFLALIMTQRLGSRPGNIARQEAAVKLTAALDAARRDARRSNSVRKVDAAALIPGLAATPILSAPADSAGIILLYPDGSSNGATVTLDGQRLLTVSWLTGEVRDAS